MQKYQRGPSLDPTIFLIYINDIVSDIQSNIILFADNISLYVEVGNRNRTSQVLNNDLDKIHIWSKTWIVTIDPDKTKTMILGRKKTQTYPALINLQRHAYFDSEWTSPSRFHLSVDCRWKTQISTILARACQRIVILRSLKFTLNRKSLERTYLTFLRSLLEYADVVWDIYMYNDLEWDILDKRRQKLKLILMSKITQQ